MEHDLSTVEGQRAYEDEARLYAQVISEANEMAPLLNQTFKARVKGSDEVFKQLLSSSLQSVAAKLSGSTFDVEVSWDFKFSPILKVHNVFGDHPAYVKADVFTKSGLLPRMLEAHALAYGHKYKYNYK